uniref:O-antigen ligase family protein n=1 Tax=Flavobacterium sp. TaxID=239 RepID=UPI00404ACEC8
MSEVSKKEATIQANSFEKMFLQALAIFLKNKLLLYVVYGVILSYFYNLAVINYSITGDNEFRLYDVLGFFILYNYYKYSTLINVVIRKVPFFKILKKFMLWASLTMVLTLIFHVINDKILSFLQVVLYMYHFWVFYLAAVFFYIFCLDKATMKKGIYFILFLSIASCIIIVLQNIGILDFLWSEAYKKAYEGFLSGTLGPNKIVTGMTSLFVLSLCLGILLEKKFKINIILLYAAVLLNIYIIIISGSRTTYVALIIMLLFFALRSPLRFILSVSLMTFLFLFVLSTNPALQKTLDDTLQKRIFGKTKVFEDEDAELTDAYEDLGAGRDELTKDNFMYLLENPLVLPFGAGFMNRFDKAKGLSAHNMYLQVIKETGFVGFFLYFGWLISYLFIKFDKNSGFSIALQGLVYAMLVTLFFGEHLYIYRPLFGLLGLFLIITSIFVSSLHKINFTDK